MTNQEGTVDEEQRRDLPWNPTNPEWWRLQIEERSKVGATVVYEWLANEWRHEDAAHVQTIEQRDNAEEWADKLAYAIGGQDIGEHSNANNPWQNALELIEERGLSEGTPS